MAAKPSPRLNTIPKTAELLGIHRDTVYTLIAAGDLDSCDIAPTGSTRSKTRVSDEHIAAFIKARTRKAKQVRAA